jgi:hypothetical protein
MSRPHWRWLASGVTVLALGGSGEAQDFQYVISFDKVTVRHPGDLAHVPAIAHAERLARETTEADASVQQGSPGRSDQNSPPRAASGGRRSGPSAGDRGQSGSVRSEARSPDADRGGSLSAYPTGRIATGSATGQTTPDEAMARGGSAPAPLATGFAPGSGTANPSFVENGFLVEAFWAARTGSPTGHFIRAHFHPADLSKGFEGQHYGHAQELHGIYIRAVDGKPFWLRSLRYRVTRNREIPRHPLSIQGFNNFNVQVLVGMSFDPRLSVRSQFIGFPVGMAISSEQDQPWSTFVVLGFERVTQLYIASSASVDLDDIAVARWEPAPGTLPNRPEQGQERETGETTGPGAEPAIRGTGDEATDAQPGVSGTGRQP